METIGKNNDFSVEADDLNEGADREIRKILHPERLTEDDLKRVRAHGRWERFNYEELTREQREAIDKFDLKKRVEDGSTVKTRACYVGNLARFALIAKRSFDKVTKEDIVNFLAKIQKNCKPNTIDNYKITLKVFFQWLYNMKGDEYPEIVEWITQSRKNNYKLPEEILNLEDIRAMVNAADNPRDKALTMVGYESACRASELLGIRIKHVTFDEYGTVIIVHGKTGDRRIRLINSTPLLKLLINHHPFKDNPEAPVWLDISKKSYGKALYRDGFYLRLKAIAKKARIKKKIYPHLLRHSRLTELAGILTEQELKIFAGWTKSSPMASVYVHLSGEDVERKILEKAGLFKDTKKREDLLKPRVCSRCSEKNSIDAKFCCKCYYPLEIDAANQIETLKTYINEFLTTKLLQKPGFMEELPKLVEEWSKGKK